MTETAASRRALSLGGAVACVVTVALFLRPGIVAVGPLLSEIREQFGLSHTEASLLTTIPDVIMGIVALPTPRIVSKTYCRLSDS